MEADAQDSYGVIPDTGVFVMELPVQDDTDRAATRTPPANDTTGEPRERGTPVSQDKKQGQRR